MTAMVMLTTLFAGTALAQEDEFWDWLSDLPDTGFGYTSDQKIEVTSVSSTKIEITSPVPVDELWDPIADYRIIYSKFPIFKVLEDISLLDEFQEKTHTVSNVDDKDSFTVELNIDDDDIDPDKIYYISIVPQDPYGMPGEFSNGVCVLPDEGISGDDEECGENNTTKVHGAASADMTLAHVTSQIDGDKITLRWTALNGASQIDIFLWNPDSENYSKLSTVKTWTTWDNHNNHNWYHNSPSSRTWKRNCYRNNSFNPRILHLQKILQKIQSINPESFRS